jgi:hypothetical protein
VGRLTFSFFSPVLFELGPASSAASTSSLALGRESSTTTRQLQSKYENI